MRWSWFAEFFGAIPEALRALWLFGDPSGRGDGWWGIVIAMIWGGLIVTALGIAYLAREDHEWVSAAMGSLGGLGVLWWLFGIVPSAFIYYVDSNKEILEHRIIPASFAPDLFGRELPIATNLYEVIRDVAVMTWHVIAVGVVIWAAFAIQKRFPKTLASGEESRESGGYK